ncbi:MAG TPA: tRNA lysidine(34) synthetase TilS [Thermoanaerobaculia bacterium]|nr:tRNA lysidine(34) synthetase TilS [Thermoanaerobaculia bacterium]
MLTEIVQRFIDANGIRGSLLVAVSGGIDSTALLIAASESGVPVIAAHVNHHLRGRESDDDEAFVRALCARLHIPLHVADGSLDRESIRRHGVEAAARDVRHSRLQEIRKATGATHIATAHQKNDQAETVLMRLVSGGGIAALRGIHAVREDGIVRPLLEITRADIEAFLRERGIEARVDRMNSDPRYLRARVRRLLAGFDASAIENLAAVARQAGEQWAVLERIIDDADASTSTADETRWRTFPADPWLRRALLLRHIRRLDAHSRDISSDDLERIDGQLDSLKRISVTAILELLKRGDEWILRRRPRKEEAFEAIVRPGERRHGITVNRQPATGNFELPKGSDPIFTIRNRRPGDRFQPLGMQREKKLKDFLIDRKIAVESRDRIPLVLWQNKIVCVAGVEISELFKVTGGGDRYEVLIEEETGQEGIQRQADRPPHRQAGKERSQRRR